jgi:fatty acid desaturase
VPDLIERAPAEGDRSLGPIRAAIPPACTERSTRRGLASVGRDLALYLAVLVALAAAERWWLVVPLELLAGLAVSGLFVLGHDAAHGALVGSKRLNAGLARLLFLPSFHVHEAWVLGHNRVHHGVFLHHIFVHVPHNVDTRIPWYKLPEAAAAISAALGDTVADRRLRLRDYLHTTRTCKLYDFDSGRWLPYAAVRIEPGGRDS